MEMSAVTESLCGENSPSDVAAIMLGDFTKSRKATGNFAMSVRPSARNNSDADGWICVKFYTRGVTVTPIVTTHDLSKSDKHDLQST